MDRINTATKAVDLFGAGKHGWKNSNLGIGQVATDFNAEWCNGVQEELLGVIEGAGIAPNSGLLTQLMKAIRRITGGNITTVNAANSPLNLTADHAGLVIMDATAGAVIANLPAVNFIASKLEFNFQKADNTANLGTVNTVGADTFVGGAVSFILKGQGDCKGVAGDGVSKWALIASGASAVAQCYLDRSALNLVLSPFNGRLLTFPAGQAHIPAAGVSLAPTGLPAATLHYIYGVQTNGVVTSLEASVTGHTVDALTGIRTKTGDATRVLIGAWKTAGAAVWSTIPTEGASYFNRRPKTYKASFTANRSTSSSTATELNTEIRVPFFMWADDKPLVFCSGVMQAISAGANAFCALSYTAVSGTYEGAGARTNIGVASAYVPFGISSRIPDAGALAEGLQFATLMCWSDGGFTSQWLAAPGYYTTNTVTIMG